MECLIVSGSGSIMAALQDLLRTEPLVQVEAHNLVSRGYYIPDAKKPWDCLILDLSALGVRKPAYIKAIRKREIARTIIAVDMEFDAVTQQSLREAGADMCLMMHQINDWLLPAVLDYSTATG